MSIKLRRTQAGLVVVALVVGIALFGPLVAPHSATGFVDLPFAQPSHAALLGTDFLGRDVLSRVLDGGRSILVISFVAAIVGVGAGTILGLLAGYVGGWVDEIVMRVLDIALAFPSIVLVLIFMALLGPQPWLIVATVGGSWAPQVARVVRAAALQIVQQDYIRYSRAIGIARSRIVFQEILPNIAAPLTVEFGLRITYSIQVVAALAYLGFGQAPPAADWGLMINENQLAFAVQPWPVMIPVLLIAILTVGTNLITDGYGRAIARIGTAT